MLTHTPGIFPLCLVGHPLDHALAHLFPSLCLSLLKKSRPCWPCDGSLEEGNQGAIRGASTEPMSAAATPGHEPPQRKTT